MSASPQSPDYTEPPLFGEEVPPKLKRVAPISDEPRWSRIGGKRFKCDDCLQVLTEGSGSLARWAFYTRTQNGFRRYLCYEHAEHWKELEQLAAIQDERYDMKKLAAEQWPQGRRRP